MKYRRAVARSYTLERDLIQHWRALELEVPAGLLLVTETEGGLGGESLLTGGYRYAYPLQHYGLSWQTSKWIDC